MQAFIDVLPFMIILAVQFGLFMWLARDEDKRED